MAAPPTHHYQQQQFIPLHHTQSDHQIVQHNSPTILQQLNSTPQATTNTSTTSSPSNDSGDQRQHIQNKGQQSQQHTQVELFPFAQLCSHRVYRLKSRVPENSLNGKIFQANFFLIDKRCFRKNYHWISASTISY